MVFFIGLISLVPFSVFKGRYSNRLVSRVEGKLSWVAGKLSRVRNNSYNNNSYKNISKNIFLIFNSLEIGGL